MPRAGPAGRAARLRVLGCFKALAACLPRVDHVHGGKGEAEADERPRCLDHDAEGLVALPHHLRAEQHARAEQFTDATQEHQRQREAEADAEAVGQRERHRVLGGERLGATEDDAVDHDERHEDAELLVEGVGIGLHQQFHRHHQRGGDGDEAGDAHLLGDDVPHHRDDHVREGENEDDRKPHAEAVARRLGHGEGGAQAEHQPERWQFLPQALGEFLDDLLHD